MFNFNVFNILRKRLSKGDLNEIQEINRIVAAEEWKLAHLRGNTALVPGAWKLVEQKEAEIKVYAAVRDDLVRRKIIAEGFPEKSNARINLKTGEIYEDD